MCKQDQQVPAIAGGLWQERLDARYTNIVAIDRLLIALLTNKIVSGDCIFRFREKSLMLLAQTGLGWIEQPLEAIETTPQVILI